MKRYVIPHMPTTQLWSLGIDVLNFEDVETFIDVAVYDRDGNSRKIFKQKIEAMGHWTISKNTLNIGEGSWTVIIDGPDDLIFTSILNRFDNKGNMVGIATLPVKEYSEGTLKKD